MAAGGPNHGSFRRAWRRFVSLLAAVAAFIAKFGILLVKLKYVGVLLTMAVSIAAYAWLWGLPFAVGFVVLLAIHEMGHVVVLRRQGVPSSLPMFIPFLGAFVNMRSMPRSVAQEATSALAGPAFGLAASTAVAVYASGSGSDFLRALAYVGFFLNLFNLLPALPLDGGRVAGAIHPVLWLVGLVALLGYEVYSPSPIIPLVLVLGGVELYRRWRSRNSPASQMYFSLRPEQRAAIGVAYVALIGIAIVGAHLTYIQRGF